ncbi:LptF/LptG family permease [Lentisphaera marina]|uniref:LptF/LptG family permease n=1 Tax=Lentisphaera marina TaxID=1111041 RepID=UPI002367310F|nr:LptF/LptG family permease [Lentisphaera marina]MDD7985863.1 LptF/LptG family permease [Lentisphaera marina]
MFFSILSRYIMRSMLLPFICCICGFIFVFFIANVQDDLSDMLKLDSTTDIISYYFLLIPDKFTYIAPMSLLLATIYCFSSLNRNHEIIAMRSAGLSLTKLSAPIYVFSILVGIGLYVSSQYIEPYCRLKTFELSTRADSMDKNHDFHVFTAIDNNSTRKWALSSDEDKNFTGIQLLEYDENNFLTREIEALSGQFSKELGWQFEEVSIAEFSPERRIKKIEKHESYSRPDIKDDPILLSNIDELKGTPSIAQIKRELNSGRPVDKKRQAFLETRQYSLIFTPFSCLIGVLLGIPLATSNQRSAGMSSASRAIGIMLIFYIINSLFTNLGRNDILPPFIAASLATVIFVSLGLAASLKD